MAFKIDSPHKKQVDMDQLLAEMVEMKNLLLSLRPAAQPEASFVDSNIQREIKSSQSLQVTSPASNVATSPTDLILLGTTDGLTLQD